MRKLALVAMVVLMLGCNLPMPAGNYGPCKPHEVGCTDWRDLPGD
ncbi:MAG: hypothetical protein ACREQA_10105 [Candidatus Binatia bacterium]